MNDKEYLFLYTFDTSIWSDKMNYPLFLGRRNVLMKDIVTPGEKFNYLTSKFYILHGLFIK